jgi:hypothetical protein
MKVPWRAAEIELEQRRASRLTDGHWPVAALADEATEEISVGMAGHKHDGDPAYRH